MNRQALIIVSVLLLIVLVAAFASPLLGLQYLRDGLAERNDARLVDVLDTERLRDNLSARVRARYAQAGIKLPINPVVERLITPAGLITAICDGGVIVTGEPSPRACDIHGSLDNIRFESPDRFSASLTQSGRVAATVVMDLAGWRWKLVDMVLPASTYDEIKKSVSK